MRRMSAVFAVLILCVPVTVFAEVVATTGFNDDAGINSDATPNSPYTLETTAHGQPLVEPGWAGPWSVVYGSALNANIQSTLVLEGDGALLLGGVTLIERQIQQPQSGTFMIKTRFRAAANSRMSTYSGNPGSLLSVATLWSIENDGVLSVLDGVGDMCDDTPGHPPCVKEDTGFFWTPDTWHSVTLIVDIAAQSWRFFFDGNEYLAPDPLGFRGATNTSANNISSFITEGSIAIDDIQIEKADCDGSSLPCVINVDAAVNGAPEAPEGHPRVNVLLGPGSYVATLINPAIDPDALFTAWTAGGTTAWRTQYGIFYENETRLGGGFCCGSSEQEAFDLTPELEVGFFVPFEQTIGFFVPDQFLGDNPGGVSLLLDTGPTTRIVPSRTAPATGSTIASCVFIDLTNPTATLGSYGMTLNWDPAVLQYQNTTGGDPPFDAPTINSGNVASGNLAFADADATGSTGDSNVACIEFLVIGAAGTSTTLDLELTSLFDAVTLADLLPATTAQDSTIDVTSSCTFGDLDGNGLVNSGDALIVLKYEIALPLPAAIEEILDAGCGDVNRDASTDSIDANITLSYEVGLPIDPAFPVGGTNATIDTCPVCSGGGALSALAEATAVSQAGRGAVHAVLMTPSHRVHRGDLFEITMALDMRDSGSLLGSYGAQLDWDTKAVELVDILPGETLEFRVPLLNMTETTSGVLRFADSNPQGASGVVQLAKVRFRALRALPHVRKAYTIEFTSIGATGPNFENLYPSLVIDQPTPGRKHGRH